MKILVTGAAGFIGSNLMTVLAKRGEEVVGIDNLNNYYDVNLKYYRLLKLGFRRPVTSCVDEFEIDEFGNKVAPFSKGIGYYSTEYPKCVFWKMDIANKGQIDELFARYHFDIVVNLAAQAGVRYSIENPDVYIQSNMIGFYNILEACRHNPVQHLVYASSSSVYGGNKKVPFSTDDRVDNPVSLYAATKKSNELFAHTVR